MAIEQPSPDQTPAGWSGYAGTYDEWLAPVTRRFADDVLRVLDLLPGMRLLDVAAGTGALAIAAARAGAEVLATDFAPGMVSLLRAKLRSAGIAAEVAKMDGQALDLPDRAFDVAASLFGLIFFPDTAAGAAELHRVLVPGGRVALTAWAADGFALQRTALEALTGVGVEDAAGSTLPAAFRLSDAARLEALLIGAGFRDVTVGEVAHPWPIGDPEALFRSIPTWSAPLRPLFERLDEAQLAAGAAAFTALVRQRSGPDGLEVRALVASGTR